MNWFKKLFKRKGRQPAPQPLRIDGIADAPLTPEPNAAEQAAQAVVESRLDGVNGLNGHHGTHKAHKSHDPQPLSPSGEIERGASYYRELAARIRQAHEASRRRALRYVAYCEQQLAASQKSRNDDIAKSRKSDKDTLATLERGLYKHLDTVEREEGELLSRWQHCLAEVIVRQMESPTPDQGDGDGIE